MNTSLDSDFEGFERDEPPELTDGSDSDSEDEYFFDWNSHIVRDELDGSSTDGDDDAMLPEPRSRSVGQPSQEVVEQAGLIVLPHVLT